MSLYLYPYLYDLTDQGIYASNMVEGVKVMVLYVKCADMDGTLSVQSCGWLMYVRHRRSLGSMGGLVDGFVEIGQDGVSLRERWAGPRQGTEVGK